MRGRRRRKEEAAAAAAAAAAAMKASAGLPAPRAPRHVLARGLPRPGGRARAAPPSPAGPAAAPSAGLGAARGGEFRGGGGDGAGGPEVDGGRARPGRRAFAPAVPPLPRGRSSRDPAALLGLAAPALRRFCSRAGAAGGAGWGTRSSQPRPSAEPASVSPLPATPSPITSSSHTEWQPALLLELVSLFPHALTPLLGTLLTQNPAGASVTSSGVWSPVTLPEKLSLNMVLSNEVPFPAPAPRTTQGPAPPFLPSGSHWFDFYIFDSAFVL